MYTQAKVTDQIAVETIKAAGPFTYFATLPFKKIHGHPPLSLEESVYQLKGLSHFMNQTLYGRKYRSQRKFMKGYLCIEDHKEGGHHFHILFKRDAVQFQKSEPNFSEVFYDSALKLRRFTSDFYEVTARKHLDIKYLHPALLIHKPNYYPNRIDDHAFYLVKDRTKPLYNKGKRWSRIYPLSENGIELCEYGYGL